MSDDLKRLGFTEIHAPSCLYHYMESKKQHPCLCNGQMPWEVSDHKKEDVEKQIALRLAEAENRVATGNAYNELLWNELLDLYLWRSESALVNDDKSAAVKSLYKLVAVALREIDVIEGREKVCKGDSDEG